MSCALSWFFSGISFVNNKGAVVVGVIGCFYLFIYIYIYIFELFESICTKHCDRYRLRWADRKRCRLHSEVDPQALKRLTRKSKDDSVSNYRSRALWSVPLLELVTLKHRGRYRDADHVCGLWPVWLYSTFHTALPQGLRYPYWSYVGCILIITDTLHNRFAIIQRATLRSLQIHLINKSGPCAVLKKFRYFWSSRFSH
jgi:hypothetical protein